MLSSSQARQRLRGRLAATPLVRSTWLSRACDAEVWLKLESLQETRSFKLRGALNAVLARLERGLAGPVVTASAGNHGRALAVAAQQAGLPCRVFVAAGAPRTKTEAIEAAGAALDDTSPDYDAAERAARQYAAGHEAAFISAYNDADVIAGAATIGLEILDALGAPDIVVVPVGGGGLASGVALAVKEQAPRCRIVGVEASGNRAFHAAREHGAITPIVPAPTLADGLSGNIEPGSMTFPLVERLVDELVSATEDQIAAAIRGLVAHERLVVEGAGAVATAALASGTVACRRQRIVVIVSGGNIDTARLARLLQGSDE